MSAWLPALPERPPKLPIPFYAAITYRAIAMTIGCSYDLARGLSEHDMTVDPEHAGQPVPELLDCWPVYGHPQDPRQQSQDWITITQTAQPRAMRFTAERRQSGGTAADDLVVVSAKIHYVRSEHISEPLDVILARAELVRAYPLFGAVEMPHFGDDGVPPA